jgi:hypothetical protein
MTLALDPTGIATYCLHALNNLIEKSSKQRSQGQVKGCLSGESNFDRQGRFFIF